MPDALSPAGDPESAKVIAVVSSIPLAVDLARYDLAEAAFAPEVVIDYTSLWGGEPQRMTPAALMDAWRGLVPGFDATRHELEDVEAPVDGDGATATRVRGRPPLDRRRAVAADRRFIAGRSSRLDGRWKVTAMTSR